MKILIAEDSGMMRRAIAKMAQESGFSVLEAENGAEALAKLRKNANDIALIILDWNMPVMNGYDALQKIRSNDEFKSIPILMATADGVEDDVVAAIKAGADSYLVKPFKPEQMIATIRKMTSPKPVPTNR